MEKFIKMDKFLTTTAKDYKEKKYSKRPTLFTPQEYKFPLSEAYKKHLDVDKTYDPDCIEEIDSYFNKAKENYVSVAKRLPTEPPVDKAVIRRDKLFHGRSTYQVDYCDIDEELEYKDWIKRNAVVLPLDIFIPLTAQKSSYREPILINSRAYQKDPWTKIPDNLTPNYKVRKILNVTTGWSDYTNKIGNLGNMIVTQELHGPVRHDFRRDD